MDQEHPLEEGARIVDPCAVVIFGATGDLTSRKLMPTLYNLARKGQLPTNFACAGFARREKTDEVFREEMQKDVSIFLGGTVPCRSSHAPSATN